MSSLTAMMVSLLWVGMVFNEVLNGLLSWRHKAPYPPSPVDVEHYIQEDAGQSFFPHTGDVQNTELGARAVQDAEDYAEPDSLLLCCDKDSHPLFQKNSFLLE